ncbi:MAG: CxxxxCH/CxxCH domain-containing protein [Geobacter sp.]|nr:CxxxxCH/CxxCH domain-containing protein [Geobacter sp.]
MGRIIAKQFSGMSLRAKICIVFTLLMGIFLYQGVIKPLIGDTATNTYYFNSTAVNVGADGTTSTNPGTGGKISMAVGTYTTQGRVNAASSTNWQVMINTYGPAYGAAQTLTSPAVTIGTRDRNGTANLIYWKADVYDYNPAGAANNGLLLWSSTGTDESHTSATSPQPLTFSNPGVKTIAANHRLKVVISCRMTSTNSQARLYWGATNGTDYSFMTVSEAAAVANSVTVSNLADYNAGGLTSVIRGQNDIAMLRFDLFQNVASNWTGGKLDKIGTNTVLSDATFSIYKDANGNGSFEPTDTLIGGPYSYTQATASGYVLTVPQVLTTTPQRYFITFNISGSATAATTIGARIVDNSYFTVTAAAGAKNVTSTSSSMPKINGTGTPVVKVYAADWDDTKTLLVPETSGPTATNAACIAGNVTTAGGLVGLLNYPNHTCSSVSGRFYTSNQANNNFTTLYYNGSSGYSSIMTLVKATSLTYRISTTTSGGTFTATMFYVKPDGTRVNSPVSSTYTVAGQVSQIINMTLAGQTFADVPAGSRLGIQIGVNRSGCGIGLGSSVGAQLTVEETAAANTNVDIGDGSTIPNANVLASSTDNVVDSFTLSATSNRTVTSVTITGNAMTTAANISKVSLYADNGNTIGVLDASDTLIGSTSTFVGNSATITGLSEAIGGAPKRYLVAYDISASPSTNIIVNGLVSALGGATIGNNTDASSATLTIIPTTTLTNGAVEPANTVISANGAATNVDAFGLKVNGGASDTIKEVTVTLSTNTPPADGSLISSKVASVQIVDKSNGTVYGTLTAPTTGDDWQIATTGLLATVGTTECYVRITPKTNVVKTYNVSALAISISHTKTSYGLVIADTTSGTVTIDGEAPSNPVLTAVSGTAGGDINLSWTASTDTSGLHPTLAYKVVRGAGNAPPPTSCSTGTVVYQGTSRNFADTGLSVAQMYGYRVCATDVANNTNAGAKASAVAGIPTDCTQPPTITVNPSSAYIKPGTQTQMTVGVSNNDTGACANSTFVLSIVGAEDSVNFTTPSTFSANNLSLSSNNGAQAVTLTITAKAGAAQGAINTFRVAASKNGGAAVQSPDIVSATVSNYGAMIHSSLQLGTKKFGAWGANYSCNTCHSDSGNNIKQIKSVINTPMGNRPVVFTTTSTSTAVTSGVFGNDHRAGTVSSNVCEVCHHNTRFHQYSASKIAWKDHNNSGDCIRCHSHNKGFKGIAIGTLCTDCHGYPPTAKEEMVSPDTNALYPFATNPGAHDKHNKRNLQCMVCHSNGNHIGSSTPAGNNQINMGFAINNTNYPGFANSVTTGTFTGNNLSNTYLWSAAPGTTVLTAPNTTTCNIYCHGWSGGGGYNNVVSWTGINQVGCGSCHDATGDAPPPGGSHMRHASTSPGGNGTPCTKCHGSKFANFSSSVGHLNGKVEWDLSAVSPTALYKGANKGNTGTLAPSASYGTCSNLYCHSNVQSANGTAGPTVYSTPTWGGVTTCNSCHGNPNTTGGHPQHVSDAVTGFDCRICHGSGGDANSLNHANGKIDFDFEGLGANTTYSYGAFKLPGTGAYGTCSNSNCHGRRTMTWGPATATPLCEKCHGSASTPAFYSTAGPGSPTTGVKTDPQVGAHDQHIKSAPYNFATASDCSACHQKPAGPYSPGHIDDAVPAEMTFGTIASSGTQYSNYTSLPKYDYATRQCSNVWCHGGGMNSNTGSGLYASAVVDGGTLGTPTIPTWNTPFLTGNAATDCTRCHSYPPPAPLPGYTHYGLTVGIDCMGCHKHLNSTATGFTDPSLHINGRIDSCNTCHGRPPTDVATLANPPINALNPGFAGAHNAHFLNPNIGSNCNTCHNNYTPAMPSNQLEIGFNGFGGKVTTGTFYGYSTLTNTVYVSSSVGTTVRRSNNAALVNACSNLYCHGGGTATLAPLGGGSNIQPDWELGNDEATCGSCHGVTSTTYVTRGSHGRHAGTGAGQLGLHCANCHGKKENNYHVNGKVEWQFYSSVLRISPTASYTPATGTAGQSGNTGNLAPSAVYGTCSVYCHSDGKGTYKPVQWGSGALNCGSCHNDQTVSPTGSHLKHVTTYGISCAICHNGAGSGTVKHVNGTIDIIFNTGVAGASATYSAGNCTNIACHDNTSTPGLIWGNAGTLTTHPANCIGCHGGSVNTREAIIPQFAGQSHHVQGATLSKVTCYACHLEADSSGNINTTYHNKTANQPVNLVIWGAGSRTTGAGFITYSATGSAAGKRTQYTKLNSHCLGCHNLQNSTTTPINPFGDGKNPKSYAWDAKSIAERYNQSTTTTWGKYAATTNAAQKNITKTFSAHGSATNNKRGWDTTNGVDGVITNTSGSVNVVCFDCHNSHGTSATGIMSSYSSATGRNKGGILKSTTNAKGGYTATYAPKAGGSAAEPSKNAYNAGAALCFDCHNTATASATAPWGYNSTFGATQAIFGYRDAPYFGNNSFGTGTRYPYKNLSSAIRSSKINHGGHFGASSPLTTAVAKPINGLCTPCHDPHGITPNTAFVSDQNYAVPLLKGTWMTSPYKEDVAPVNVNEVRGGTNEASSNGVTGGSTSKPIRQLVGSTPMYFIDQNTFGTTSFNTLSNPNYGSAQNPPSWSFPNAANRITQTDAQFAGLCMQCHTKAALAPKAGLAVAPDAWKSVSRIHGTVKGWATTTAGSDGNASNAIHSYSCSKCHSPHNSNLPRLMVTNCLDFNHRGRVVSGGTISATNGTSAGSGGGTSIAGSGHQIVTGNKGDGRGRYPAGGNMRTNNNKDQNPGVWFFGLSASGSSGVFRNCHGTATGAGAAGYPNNQQWNNKTPW